MDDDQTFGVSGVRPQVRMGLVDDLSRLDILDEEIILRELEQRYEDGKYYTFLGDVLVAVNPFRELPIYSVQHHDIYNDHESSPRSPHIFWMAQQAYRNLLDSKRDQCILVSGESGAGKTESTKLIIRHLAYMSSESDNALHEMIVQVNPLLEAFGNAQTIMNNNSSRFGKYVELLFRENGQISGARIHDYLLEKSRVVYRGAGERNFHIFYYLFAGMSEDQLLYYYLEDPKLYRIMQTSSSRDPLAANRSYFKEKFQEQLDIMKLVGFTEEDISTVFTLLSAILHLTNITFVEDPETDGVQIDDEYPLRVVVNLLCVDIEELTSALISNVIYVKGEKVETLKKISQAEDGRDALAKALYARLFGWTVAQINYHIQPQTKDGIDGPTIGILDMSGFEQFPQNSFEQICINAANERLQKFFNENIFALEQKDYENEGIDLNTVVFKSNEPLIDLFFKKPTGIFYIIDEESTFPRATDATLVQKLNYLCSSSPYYKKTQGDQSLFAIQHYAGEVNYDANGFLEKNRDSLSQTLVDCLVSSTNDVVGALFLASLSDTGSISGTVTSRSTRSRSSLFRSRVCRSEASDSISKATATRVKSRQSLKSSSESIFSAITSASDFKHQSTMSKQFMRSLADLMKKMSKAKPWFIRCIRPHKQLTAGPFLPDVVLEQLRCNGLMEIAKIRRDGFAIRMTPTELVERFKVISFEPEDNIQPTYGNVKSILKDAGVEGHAYGKTKLFLRYWHGPMLQKKARQRWQEIKAKREAERPPPPPSEPESEPPVPAMFSIEPISPQDEDARSTDSESSSERIQEWIKQNEKIMLARTPPHESPPPPFVPPEPRVSRRVTLSGHDVTDKKVLDPRMWDRFQMIPRERVTASESFEPILRLFKVICYILLFFFVLGSAVVNKVTILLLASGLQEQASPEKQDATKTMLVIMMCFPYASWLIFYSLRSLFGGSAWPSLKTTVIIFFLELLHSFGLALLLFRVLPRTDMIRGLILMSSICLIPGLFKTISIAKSPDYSKVTRILLSVVNGFAFLIQLASIPVMILLGFLVTTRSKADIQQTVFSDEDVYNVVRRPDVQTDFTDICWELPVALLCISLIYWENYIDGDLMVGSIHIPFAKWKKELYLIRERLYIFVGVWKIAWTMIFALFLLPGFNFNMFFPGMNDTSYDNASTSANTGFLNVAALSGNSADENATNIGDALNIPQHVQKHFEYFGPLYVQMVSSLCCSFLGSLACKLCMQHVAFSLPLFLATPVSFTVILMQCYYNWIPPYVNAYIWFCPETQGEYLTYHLLWLGAVWISHMIITSHIWFPKSDRMAKLDKLFVAPLRCGILTDASLLLRRRWNDKDLSLFRSDYDEEDDESMHKANDVIPMIYATATMWHETRNEMTQLLKSIFRMDADHSARSLAQTYYNIKDPDYYEFEAHIFFDDAMELTDDDTLVPNSFVAELVDCVDDALSSVHERQMYLGPAARIPTPYGGRLTWRLPGGTRLNVHLKDKHKIRHKKRWSQVMYMYYLLGFRIFALPTDNVKTTTEKPAGEQQEGGKRVRLTASQLRRRRQAAHFTRSVIFNYVDEDVHTQAENTYLLTLDGDVDFKPDAVRLLVDRLKKNKKVGAACGRIHPTGSGPICWYQEFEYAIGHWLQKATEHVFGCVLCAPGCFSLFRGSALVDDNVARTYAIRATEAGHYVQYDQGEDRWLSTLLLQQGYRIEYCAAADALTHAPETFSEFFNQRRRWGPSTLANVIDLLGNWKNTVALNDNISTPYILYQFFILVSTVLGPATVMLMMAGAFNVVLKTDVMGSYALSLSPPILFMIFCFLAKPGAQVVAASMLSALYAIVMMIVIVGTVANAIEGSVTSPNVIFLVMLVGIFVVAALMHPEEVLCIIPGALYFICIPTGYLVLTIYYLCNMHIVSWGTREVPKRKSREEIQEEKIKEEAKRQKKQDRKGIFGWLGLNSIFHEMAEMFRQLRTYTVNNNKTRTDSLLEELVIELRHSRNSTGKMESMESLKLDNKEESIDVQPTVVPRTDAVAPWMAKEDPNNPGWLHHEIAGCGPIHKLDNKEMAFWTQLSKKYLHPIVEDKQHQEKMDRDLKNLRNNVVFGFFMTSSLWIALSLQLEILQEELKDTLFFQIPRLDPNRKPLTFEPLGLLFLFFFAAIICFQFIGMLIHRWGTILHVLAITDVACGSKLTKADEVRDIIRQTMELQRVSNIENEPEPDYDEPIPDYEAEDDYEDESSSFYTTVTESDVTPPSYHTNAENRMLDKQRKREIFNRRGFATGRTLRKAFLKRFRRMRQDEIRDDRTDYSMTTRSRYTAGSSSTVAPSRMTSRSRPSILPQYNDPNRQTM